MSGIPPQLRPRLVDSLGAALPGVRVGALIASAVCVHIVAAWFNGGFLFADEHYQIIEFAQYKLGLQPASELAWEFAARIRPGLQPWLAAGIIRTAHAAGVASPFLIAFSLRLLSTLLALWVQLELCVRFLPTIKTHSLRLIALGASLFLWMAPTIHARFSSENWGGALWAAGLCLMLDAAEAWPARRMKAFVLAVCTGLVWSAAFYCRFQVGLLIAGAGFWLLIIRRVPVVLVSAIGASFVAACVLNELIDHWLYGSWVLAPYNYFAVQLVQGRAAGYGVSPWWMVAVYITGLLIPPYSIAVLALFAVGCWYARRHVLVWAAAPFLIVHAIVMHKESRFLIPLLYLAGPLFAVCVSALPAWLRAPLFAWSRTRGGRVNLTLLGAVNLLLLLVTMFAPAVGPYRLFRWLWAQSRGRQIVMYTVGGSPYMISNGMSNSFYRSPNVNLVPIDTVDELRAVLNARNGGPVLMFYKRLKPPPVIDAVASVCRPLLRTFPEWLPRFDYFNSLAHAQVATICRIEAAP